MHRRYADRGGAGTGGVTKRGGGGDPPSPNPCKDNPGARKDYTGARKDYAARLDKIDDLR